VHPYTRAQVTIEARIPQDFEGLLDTADLSLVRSRTGRPDGPVREQA